MESINGFSKLNKEEKISWLCSQLPEGARAGVSEIQRFWNKDRVEQKIFDDFSENTISNFYFPYGVAPNFLINDKIYTVPLVTEESSVVAAASRSAKFWLSRGGFKARVISTTKSGQVHFNWRGDKKKLFDFFSVKKAELLVCVKDIVKNMEKRGGGVTQLSLRDKTDVLENYYQLDAKFETCDAMGANFINSVLEALGDAFQYMISQESSALDFGFSDFEREVEIIMCILSNYTPECLVNVYVECPVSDLGSFSQGMRALDFAKKIERAVTISKIDISRAVTHNKGIFNGIDALILATGNDFRAVEACGHAYASRDGQYRGLSNCVIKDDIFRFELTIPLALGTVGGLTKLHPLARTTLSILGNPGAKELMGIVGALGLAQNFAALEALVTTGIQKGHMKMHLLNILNQLGASAQQVSYAKEFFKDKIVSFSAVRDEIELMNKLH